MRLQQHSESRSHPLFGRKGHKVFWCFVYTYVQRMHENLVVSVLCLLYDSCTMSMNGLGICWSGISSVVVMDKRVWLMLFWSVWWAWVNNELGGRLFSSCKVSLECKSSANDIFVWSMGICEHRSWKCEAEVSFWFLLGGWWFIIVY